MIVVFFAATVPLFAHLCKKGKAAAKDLFGYSCKCIFLFKRLIGILSFSLVICGNEKSHVDRY